jgi:hypothetical protein
MISDGIKKVMKKRSQWLKFRIEIRLLTFTYKLSIAMNFKLSYILYVQINRCCMSLYKLPMYQCTLCILKYIVYFTFMWTMYTLLCFCKS